MQLPRAPNKRRQPPPPCSRHRRTQYRTSHRTTTPVPDIRYDDRRSVPGMAYRARRMREGMLPARGGGWCASGPSPWKAVRPVCQYRTLRRAGYLTPRFTTGTAHVGAANCRG
eukprot:407533-Rhodomonas_salina.3